MGEPQARTDHLVGTVIQDRFLVLERIASGGMGVVYRGEQVPLGRSVALKVLEPKQDARIDDQFSERFFLEAASVAKLSHPNTIVLYDYGRMEAGLYYHAMEFIDGTTLTRKIFDEGPLSPRDIVHMGVQVSGSLRDAHSAGLVHRDLKPGNIMFTERGSDPLFVKVLDFGLVKWTDADSTIDLTESGMLMGSPRYMAPEQVRGEDVDPRSDIYSLGAVLYHAAAGLPPFAQSSHYEVLKAQVEDAPPALRETHPECEVSPRLERLIMHCLRKERSARPQTMNQVLAELVACAEDDGLQALSISSACLPLPETPASVSPDPSSVSTATSKASEPTPAESEGSDPRKRGLWALLGFVVVGAIIGVWLAPSSEEAARSPDGSAVAPSPGGGSPEQLVADPVTSPAVAPSSPVRLITYPSGARVRRGDEDLGDGPLTLTIPEGERWEILVEYEGYDSRTVSVSAGRGEVEVRLRPSPAPSTGRRSARRTLVGAAEERPALEAERPTGSTSRAGSDTNTSEGAERWGRRTSDNRDPWAQ